MTTASSKLVPPASAASPQNGFSLISDDKLLEIYRTMLKCRMLQACIRTFARENGAGRSIEQLGQEALAAGIVLDMLPGDTLAPSPCGFMHCFVKGLPLAQIFSEHSLAANASRPRYAPLNLISPSRSLAVQLDRALEAAKANKAARKKKIVVAFCGNSSRAWDTLHEAMRRAGRLNLPILFVCHSAAHADDICQYAQACDFPGVIVDGDDAVAVYRVSTEAMAHARRGSGPTLIECRPWSLSGGASGNSVVKMEKYLGGKGLSDPRLKASVTRSFRLELNAALKATGLEGGSNRASRIS